MSKTAFNTAKTNYYIFTRLCILGGLTCVPIGQCTNIFIRKFFFNFFSNLVHKPKHKSSFTSFFLYDCLTIFTLTWIAIIILRNRVNQIIRLFTNNFLYPFFNNFQHIRIGKAKLTAALIKTPFTLI